MLDDITIAQGSCTGEGYIMGPTGGSQVGPPITPPISPPGPPGPPGQCRQCQPHQE